MTQIHFNTAFQGMSIDVLKTWFDFNHERLIGSSIFTKNNSATSKLVRWAESRKCEDKRFIPSHTGSIIEYNNDLYLFDMKPMRAKVTPLVDYILNTDDEYALILRDFQLNTRMFSINVAEHIGEFYPFMSAIRSVFSKRQSKLRTHCSELHARTLDSCGYKFPKDFNFECTPLELFNLLSGS